MMNLTLKVSKSYVCGVKAGVRLTNMVQSVSPYTSPYYTDGLKQEKEDVHVFRLSAWNISNHVARRDDGKY